MASCMFVPFVLLCRDLDNEFCSIYVSSKIKKLHAYGFKVIKCKWNKQSSVSIVLFNLFTSFYCHLLLLTIVIYILDYFFFLNMWAFCDIDSQQAVLAVWSEFFVWASSYLTETQTYWYLFLYPHPVCLDSCPICSASLLVSWTNHLLLGRSVDLAFRCW